ncbi:MAG: hypothetical protein WDO15_15140 [Bacteroidota bacterium]
MMINSGKLKLANASLIALALFYLIMLGGGNYEQLTITRLVTSAPPKSLYILQGPYGFRPMVFWAIFRPITILLFVITLVTNWNHTRKRRNLLLIAFGIDVLTTIATYTYFAPETGAIANAKYDPSIVDQIQCNARSFGKI